MTISTSAIISTTVLLLSLSVQQLNASETPSPGIADFTAAAIKDADTGAPSAESELEAALEWAPVLDRAIEGSYWQAISRHGDFPRAYHFFTVLKGSHPHEAEYLACAASASSAYIGWLFQHGIGMCAAPLRIEAEADFSAALVLEPENFTARFGEIVYDSYNPKRLDACRQELASLLQLRGKHPEYPWAVVDGWTAQHPTLLPR